MDFNFSEEQTMLGDSLSRYLADAYGFEQRKLIVNAKPGEPSKHWRAFADDLGILGASFSEAHGGYAATGSNGSVETMIVMEAFGKALVVEPYLGTVVIGGGFMKHSGNAIASDVIAKIISGDALLAFAYAEPQGRHNMADLCTTAKRDGGSYSLNGHKAVVIGAPSATHYIVTARTSGAQWDRDGVSVFLVDARNPNISRRDYPTVDGQQASELYFEAVSVPAENLLGAEGQGLPLIEQVVDEAIAALSAEAVGCMRKLHEGTVDYARQRKQFGVSISSFQVLQHAMVDMFMEVELAVSMTTMLTLKLGLTAHERGMAASAAKVQIGKSCKFVGQNAIQIHGGIGISNELAIGHYFKRSTMIESQFGSVDYHLQRYEALSAAA